MDCFCKKCMVALQSNENWTQDPRKQTLPMTAPATLLKAWNLMARKELGQNFLKDPSLAGQIADLAQLESRDIVIDIGAGLGAMTIAAATRAQKVIAVEKDARMLPLLRAELLVNGIANVEVLSQDILSLDLSALARSQERSVTIVGNLPYNISSQVVIKLMAARRCISKAVLMFQKELAERLCAAPGSRTYGRISVMLQYCAKVKVLRQVRADMFFPRPKVDSVVLGIAFKTDPSPGVEDEQLMGRVVQAAFGQRRKTLHNALASGLSHLDRDGVARVLNEAGIDPKRRAETLSVAEFVDLTNCVGRYLS